MNILITGTSKGIGKYLAEYYTNKGNYVIGFSRTYSGDNWTGDIANIDDIKAMIKVIRNETIDVLINNAGIASMNSFMLTPSETARRIMEVNFLGTFNMCREVARLMRKSENPRIINFSSVAVPLNLEGEAAYAASKAAVESLTKILAKELAPITVNAIAPCPIKTDLIANVPEDKLQKLIDKQAIKRYGTMEDISNVIDFFIKPESNFVTGQIIYLGGIN